MLAILNQPSLLLRTFSGTYFRLGWPGKPSLIVENSSLKPNPNTWTLHRQASESSLLQAHIIFNILAIVNYSHPPLTHTHIHTQINSISAHTSSVMFTPKWFLATSNLKSPVLQMDTISTGLVTSTRSKSINLCNSSRLIGGYCRRILKKKQIIVTLAAKRKNIKFVFVHQFLRCPIWNNTHTVTPHYCPLYN